MQTFKSLFYISETCYCDGTEDFDCKKIKTNMEALCFKKPDEDIFSNEIDVDRLKAKKSSSSSLKDKFERIILIITVIVGIFVSYICASVNAMYSSLSSEHKADDQTPSSVSDPRIW